MVAHYGFDEWDHPDAGEDTDPAHFGGGQADNDRRYVKDALTWLEALTVMNKALGPPPTKANKLAYVNSYANLHRGTAGFCICRDGQ